MASLASINVRFNADLSDFSSQMQNSLRSIDSFGQKMQSVGRSLTVAVTAPIIAMGAGALSMAKDYEESINKVDVAFKSAAPAVKTFADTTLENFGIAKGTALDMAATYGDMATSMGLPVVAASKMSTSLVGLAGDLASFKNIGIDQANTALTAVFTGETESIKKLGIVMTEANLQEYAYSQGIKSKVADLDQASKVQLRYNYVLSVAKNSQGDFNRTQGGAANQTRIFTESLKQVGQQIGAVILPIFTKIITAINEKIKAFSKLSEGTKTVIVVIAGLAAVIGPLVFAIGAVAAAIPTVVAGFALLSSAALPIVAAITLIGGALFIFSDKSKKAATATNELTTAQKLNKQITTDATTALVSQKAELLAYLDIARDETKSKKERLEAIKAINKISPEYLGNLNLENIGTNTARVAIEKYNEALLKGAKAKAAQEVLQELYKKEIETSIKREKAETSKNKLLEESNKKQFTSAAAQKNYNDLLNDKSGALKSLRTQEDKDSKTQIAVAAKIYNQGKDYLGLLKDTGTQAEYNANVKDKKVKEAKVKRPEAQDLPAIGVVDTSGLKDRYDSEIQKLEEFRDKVATTAEEIKAADKAIQNVQFAKTLAIDPASLIGTAESVEEMTNRMTMALNGSQAAAEASLINMTEVAGLVGESLGATFSDMATGLVGSLGLATTGFEGFVGGLASTIIKLISMMLASSISQSIAGATSSGTATGPAAVVATPVFIATAVSGVLAAFAAIPKFQTGGVVGGSSFYGDKILARVNSGEMIANTDQQKKIFNSMSSAGGGVVTILPDLKIKGSDLLVVFNRANDRNTRTR